MIKKFKIDTGCYGMDIYFVICSDPILAAKHVSKDLGKVISPDEFAGFNGLTFSSPRNCPVIWMPSPPKTPRQYGTLSHELLHIVFHVMDYVGVELSPESEEAYTYLLSYLLTQALTKMK